MFLILTFNSIVWELYLNTNGTIIKVSYLAGHGRVTQRTETNGFKEWE